MLQRQAATEKSKLRECLTEISQLKEFPVKYKYEEISKTGRLSSTFTRKTIGKILKLSARLLVMPFKM